MNTHTHTPAEVFKQMTDIVEQPGYPLLQSHKGDLYEIDKQTILDELAMGSIYAWTVNFSGTYLTRIGVHPKQNEWAAATINHGLHSHSTVSDIFLVSTEGVRKVSEAQAKAQLEKWQYTVSGQNVRDAKGNLIATFALREFYISGNPHTEVSFQCPPERTLSKSDLLALRDIGNSESVVASHSFFVKIDAMTVNGRPMLDMIVESAEVPASRSAAEPSVATARRPRP